jgi:hypothetical protein
MSNEQKARATFAITNVCETDERRQILYFFFFLLLIHYRLDQLKVEMRQQKRLAIKSSPGTDG